MLTELAVLIAPSPSGHPKTRTSHSLTMGEGSGGRLLFFSFLFLKVTSSDQKPPRNQGTICHSHGLAKIDKKYEVKMSVLGQIITVSKCDTVPKHLGFLSQNVHVESECHSS
jgi:hypothetical protein